MVIIELTYLKSLDEVNEHLEAHRAFLQQYYDAGVFLASGPKEPRDGGVILALTDIESAKEITQEDPFYQQGIANYGFIQFNPNKFDDKLASFLAS